ncbi:MAG: TldD/PmbA family protein [candidate division Zixibacteria bacterium]|nr:TldD/PmbA family protein [candidate division Zixibacteria bacterium]
MDKKDRLKLVHWVVDTARKKGADDASVTFSYERDISVSHRDGELEELSESTSNSLGLAIYANSKYSSHSTNDLRKDNLQKFIEEAVAMTKYLSKDEYRTLPDPKYYDYDENIDLDINDKSYSRIDSDRRVDIAKKIEETTHKKDKRIISCTAGYGDNHFETIRVRSNGFEGVNEGTVFYAGVEVTIQDDDGGRPQDWSYATVRHFKDLPEVEYFAEEAIRRARSKLGQTKIESGRYDMILENRNAGRLIYALYGPLQASSIQQKQSFLEGKKGERVGSEKLTIVDDPLIKQGLGSRLYDSDCIAAKKRVMIDKGILKDYYVDWYYGRKLGMEPTSGSRSNMVFGYGDKSMDDIIRGTGKGILVTGFIGGNSNSTTGDFSYGIIGSYVEDGKIIKPVNEMNISGNLSELMMSLTEMGNDPYEYSSMKSPTMLFKDVYFSGI